VASSQGAQSARKPSSATLSRISPGAAASRSAAGDLAARAGAIRTIPGETRPEGPVRVGDGVLDAFIAEADALL
jgi:hyaluronoglucosaminidase